MSQPAEFEQQEDQGEAGQATAGASPSAVDTELGGNTGAALVDPEQGGKVDAAETCQEAVDSGSTAGAEQARRSSRQDAPAASEPQPQSDASAAPQEGGSTSAQAPARPASSAKAASKVKASAKMSPAPMHSSAAAAEADAPAVPEPLDMEVIREKARRDIDACRSRRSVAPPDPLRGFGGATFRTPKGRSLSPHQFLASVERFSRVPGYQLLEWNADGSVKMPPAQRDPRAKYLPKEQLEAAQARLCTVAEAPPRPPPQSAIWVKQALVQGSWVDVEQPWLKLSGKAKTEKMRSMYDRYKEDEEKRGSALSDKYLQPLGPGQGANAAEHLQRYHLRLLQRQLPPELHGRAKQLVKTGTLEEAT